MKAQSHGAIRFQDVLTPGALKPLVAHLHFQFPRWCSVHQRIQSPRLPDVEGMVRQEMHKEAIRRSVRPGDRIAVGVGSRHFADMALVVRECVEALKAMGARPFIVPAMGSHGGSSAEGQAETLAGYGIHEHALGVPVEPSMEVEVIGQTPSGVPVRFARSVLAADGVMVVARVKPHTAFRGPIESGIAKMLTIGLGKQQGAESLHRVAIHKFKELIPDAATVVLKKVNVIGGLAVVENHQDQIGHLEAIPGDQILSREPALLAMAWEWMPRILVEECDLLIVDEIGKNISGDGMDPNVTGRFAVPGMTGGLRTQKVVVRDLTELTHGSFVGAGSADIMTRRVLEKADFRAGYMNAITATVMTGVKLPVIMETDRDAIGLGLASCNEVDPIAAKVVRIKNTLNLSRIWVSEAVLRDQANTGTLEPLTSVQEMTFDEHEHLVDPQ
jgi:hypothetical protein